MKSVLGGPQLAEMDNFHFLRGHIVRHLKGKSEFRASKGSASQASAAADSASRRETVNRALQILTSNQLSWNPGGG